MACLEKPALPVCILLIRGKLLPFCLFRWVVSQRRGRKMGQWLAKGIAGTFKEWAYC